MKEVEDFLSKHRDFERLKDVGIDDIRHLIPILFQLLDGRDLNNTKRRSFLFTLFTYLVPQSNG